MLNLCLPMKVIRITQHSAGSYSHPNNCLDLAGSDSGIDFAFAMGDYWKCISGPFGYNTYFFTACDAKGNAVKVHCADDVNRVVTVALTHANFKHVKQPVIGKIYKNGEPFYEEGTKGKATGNHIHYEVAQGLQYSKYKDETMGVYRMHNELMPERVCFICDSFSTIADMGGAVMKCCESVNYEKKTQTLKSGYNEYVYNNTTIHVYKQTNEKIGIVACEYGKVCNIEDVQLPDKKIKAVMNANYFIMNNGGYLGRVQGFKNNSTERIDARPASPAEYGSSEDKPFMDLVLTKDGNIVTGDFNSWDFVDVVFGTSPAGVEILNGSAVNKYSPEVGYGKVVNKNTQSVLIRDSDGKFAFATVEYGLTPINELQDWGLILGFNHLSVYDSGGSTQLLVDGKIKQRSSDSIPRKCPVWFVMYEDEEEQPFPTERIGTVHCADSGMYIRNSIRGEIKYTIRRGEVCELLEFIDGIQSDGYQWIKVRFNDVYGYAQLDTSVCWVELGG